MRIVVLGYVVRGPIGGLAWHHFQYVAGLARLGHDVLFVEDSDDYPACYDPSRHVMDTDPAYGLRFADDAFTKLGLGDRWAYYDAHTSQWKGRAKATAQHFCESADIVMNVSGVNPLRDWTAKIPLRILIDTDPVFTQVRNLVKPGARDRSNAHNVFFTFAENVATRTAQIPDDGFHWQATRQPVVLDLWQNSPAPAGPYTTVMQWTSYPAVELNGISYATKSASFEPYLDMPRRSPVSLEIALGGTDAPREMLEENGWLLKNPLEVAGTPWDYQDYIRHSRGEWSVAKHGYIVSNSGWFSERSACYLASGRPVVTQETGFSAWIPVGSGLFAFRDQAQALSAIQEIEARYEDHSKAARSLAEDFFDSKKVLGRLLSDCL